jgi:hypothetical protein
MQDFIGFEPLLERPIAFHRCFMQITTNCPIGALYLSQAWYWRDRGKKSDGWIYKTSQEFFLETGLSKKQQIRVRKILETKTWWQEKVERVGTVPTFHYRIDRSGLLAEIAAQRELSESAQRELSESAQRELSESAQRELSESAQRELSIYKDSEITNKDYLSETTLTDPDRASSEILETEFWDEEPEPPQPTRNSESKPTPPVRNPTPREVEISPPCRTTETTAITPTGYLAKTEKRYSQMLSRLELTELTQALIDVYNSSKPSSWGTCTKLTAFLVKQVDELIRSYSQFVDINEAVESLKNDIGAAFVSLRGDKFYDNKDFGQKTIGFYLDAKNVDRLQKRAQVWYDRPQQAKEQLAHKIADGRVDGTPCHLTGELLSGMLKASASRRFKKYLGLPLDNSMRNGLPPIEHLQKYYPELLEN